MMIAMPIVTSAWRRSWPAIHDSRPRWMTTPMAATATKPAAMPSHQLPVTVTTLTPTYAPRTYMAPCAMFVVRSRPKIRVKPLATMK